MEENQRWEGRFAVKPTCGSHLLLEFPSPAAPNNNNLSFMPAHCVYNNCFKRWEKEKWKVTQLRRLSVLPQEAFSPRFCFDYIPQHTQTSKHDQECQNEREREQETEEEKYPIIAYNTHTHTIPYCMIHTSSDT
jgi:hypothetical protein